jgi:hypothetical protein
MRHSTWKPHDLVCPQNGSVGRVDPDWGQTPVVENLATDLRQTPRLGDRPLLGIFEWGQTPMGSVALKH